MWITVNPFYKFFRQVSHIPHSFFFLSVPPPVINNLWDAGVSTLHLFYPKIPESFDGILFPIPKCLFKVLVSSRTHSPKVNSANNDKKSRFTFHHTASSPHVVRPAPQSIASLIRKQTHMTPMSLELSSLRNNETTWNSPKLPPQITHLPWDPQVHILTAWGKTRLRDTRPMQLWKII